MHSETAWRTGLAPVCAPCFALIVLSASGCVPQSGDSSSLPELVLAAQAPRPPAQFTYTDTEPNDDYTTAQPISVDGIADLNGSIAPSVIDRDIFDLGPGAVGDRIQAELTISNNEDVLLGVLDPAQTIVGMLDLSASSAGPRKMDIFLHEAVDHLYIILTTRSTSTAGRNYTARITYDRGVGVPADRPQVVALNFSGAQGVRVGGRAAVNVPTFDAAAISPRFAGQTNTIVQNILSMSQDSYSGLGVQIYVDGDPAMPAGDHSTVYYGTYDAALLGLADNVDPYNSNDQQSAILYTDTFALFDALSPDVEAISQVLANTTCHEIGHLLGLRHTSNVKDIMDTTASARQMLLKQTFTTANLNPTVMNFGMQDAPNLLGWAVGGTLTQSPPSDKQVANRAKAIETASGGADFYVPRDQLAGESQSQDDDAPGVP